MAEAHGVGLAAQQVAVPLQLFVIDVRGVEDRPSTMEIDGRPVDPAEHMPMALINTRLRPTGAPETGPEGCLSFPEIYADITRPASVEVRAQDEHGRPVHFHCGGLLARAIQHEYDHTHAVLFIDRMAREVKEELQAELDRLHSETKRELAGRAAGRAR
ncbi:MAG: peptide deformylase [Verrucomicrobia bacterium]|nr:MAG: peptide deformylase [Verrucomicrobiota bacterium]